MTLAQRERHLKLLRKVLAELAAKNPYAVTPAYIERRITEERKRLDANATEN